MVANRKTEQRTAKESNEDEILELRKLNQRFSFTSIQMHEGIGRKAELSGTDHKYLGFLVQRGKMTAGELASLSGLTTGAVTGLIDRFEKKGLVTRQLSPDDRRKVLVFPNTKKITELLTPLYYDYRSKIDKMFASFSHDERKAVKLFLSESIDIMNETIKEHSKRRGYE